MVSKRSTFFFAAAFCALSSCATPLVEPEPSGIPARSGRDCTKVSATNLGASDSVFACRGRFVSGPEGFVAGFKGRQLDDYSLLSFNPAGDAVGRRVTDHRGPKFLLTRLGREIMLATWSGSFVRYGMHGSGLGGSGALRELTLASGRVLDISAASVSTSGSGGLRARAVGGAVLAVATGFGVEVWLLDQAGDVVVTRKILEHPEMEYCDRVAVDVRQHAGFSVVLQCDGVLPLPPEARERSVVIRDFNWGAKIESGRTILASFDDDLAPLDVTMTVSEPTSAPPRYALRRYLEDQIPRGPGERVRVVDAVAIGERRYLSLGCIGSDGELVRVEATLLTCGGP